MQAAFLSHSGFCLQSNIVANIRFSFSTVENERNKIVKTDRAFILDDILPSLLILRLES